MTPTGRQDLAAVELKGRLDAFREIHEHWEFADLTEAEFDDWLHEHIRSLRKRLALLLAEARRVNVCQCHHSREQHGAGESPRCLVDGCPCTYFVLVVSTALLETRGVPQEEKEQKENDTRVVDSQYDPPSARPLATASGIEAIRAEAIARAAHFGQVEESTGDDYMRHIERVVALVDCDDAKAVAWLHDVWEDTTISGPAMEAAGISGHVVDAVRLLTRIPAEPYERYILFIKHATNPLARIVKLADLRDHLRPNCPARLRPRYEAALAVLTSDGGNQPERVVRGDPGVDRRQSDGTRDLSSSSSTTCIPSPAPQAWSGTCNALSGFGPREWYGCMKAGGHLGMHRNMSGHEWAAPLARAPQEDSK